MGSPSPAGSVTDLLVVGYGNDLRSDDRAGRVVAEAIDEMGLDGVEVRSQSQLTPELALEVAGRARVVFVDANVDVTEMTRFVVEAGPPAGGPMTHHGDPASLLALVRNVGEQPGEAIVLSIPASNLEMGFELSEATAAGVDQAIAEIVELSTEY